MRMAAQFRHGTAMRDQAAEKVFRAREMAKFGGSKLYPRGSPNAYTASNRVRDFELGLDKDFFRNLVSMRADAKDDGAGRSPSGLA
jgi:hypothetical protein